MNSSFTLFLIWLACVGISIAQLFVAHDVDASASFIAASFVVAAIQAKGGHS